APSRAHGVDLDGGVRPAGLGQPRKGHDAAVTERRYRRIPAPMRHVFQIREYTEHRIERGAPKLPVERVVLQVAAVDEETAIGQGDHAVAEHVPRQRLRGYAVRPEVPHRGSEVRLG